MKKTSNPIKRGVPVDSKYCVHAKPKHLKISSKICVKNCEVKNFRWIASQWSKCTVGCGSGYRTRSVQCSNGLQTNQTACNIRDKPIKSEICESKEHCAWRTGKWKSVCCIFFFVITDFTGNFNNSLKLLVVP